MCVRMRWFALRPVATLDVRGSCVEVDGALCTQVPHVLQPTVGAHRLPATLLPLCCQKVKSGRLFVAFLDQVFLAGLSWETDRAKGAFSELLYFYRLALGAHYYRSGDLQLAG